MLEFESIGFVIFGFLAVLLIRGLFAAAEGAESAKNQVEQELAQRRRINSLYGKNDE